MNVSELRAIAQGPRKNVDTWLGRNVMRKLSIYLTWFFIKQKWSPNSITLVSFIFALLAPILFAYSRYGSGYICLFIWYLLDHVDGEMARVQQICSAKGLFLDSVINVFVHPLTFLGLAWGLSGSRDDYIFLFGLSASLGSFFITAIALYEDNVVLGSKLSQGKKLDENNNFRNTKQRASLPKLFFSFLKETILFPNCLIYLGVVILAFALDLVGKQWIDYTVVYYAIVVNIVWMGILTHRFITPTIESRI